MVVLGSEFVKVTGEWMVAIKTQEGVRPWDAAASMKLLGRMAEMDAARDKLPPAAQVIVHTSAGFQVARITWTETCMTCELLGLEGKEGADCTVFTVRCNEEGRASVEPWPFRAPLGPLHLGAIYLVLWTVHRVGDTGDLFKPFVKEGELVKAFAFAILSTPKRSMRSAGEVASRWAMGVVQTARTFATEKWLRKRKVAPACLRGLAEVLAATHSTKLVKDKDAASELLGVMRLACMPSENLRAFKKAMISILDPPPPPPPHETLRMCIP